MVRIRQAALCAGFACLLLLGGCRSLFGGKNCHKPQVYEEAMNMPPLRTPAGLDAIDTRNALKIPELREPEAPRPANGPCLDEPPQLVMPPASPSPPPPLPAK